MRAQGVEGVLPWAELAVELFRLPGTGGEGIELLGVGAVGTLDGAVELDQR